MSLSDAHALPPRFDYEELPDGRLLMRYYSERGLCAVLRGLILGVGILFDQEIGILETACSKKGDALCMIEVAFQ